MSTSVRPVMVPALAAALIAVTPAVIAPQQAPAALPAVHVEELQLAGIGQDIYQSITAVVQQAVGGVSYIINFIPIVGGLIAAQININYFQGIQPIIEATVNYAASIVQNPLNFLDNTRNYGVTLYDIGYNYVSAQLQFLGLNPLTPLPPLPGAARDSKPSPRVAAARTESLAPAAAKTRAPRAAAADRAVRPAAARPARATAAAAHTPKPARAARAARAAAHR